MATTKTLTPTNQAITIAAFTEKPDNRINATNDDKLADAINSLNSNFTYTTMSTGTNLNTLKTKANYRVGNLAQMTNTPSDAGTTGLFFVDVGDNFILQRFWGNLDKAHRFSYDGGSTWTNWICLNSKMTGYNAILVSAGAKFSVNSSRVQRYGSFITGVVIVDATASYGDTDLVATIPEGYRPSQVAYGMKVTMIRGSNTTYFGGSGRIETNGNIFENFTASGGQSGDKLIFEFNYIIGA